MKIIIANTNIQDLLKATDNILDNYGRDDVPESIRGQATLASLKKCFTGDWFDICRVDDLLKMNNCYISKEKRDLLQTLHCVHYSEMTEDTKNYLHAILIDVFRTNIVMAQTNYEKRDNS